MDYAVAADPTHQRPPKAAHQPTEPPNHQPTSTTHSAPSFAPSLGPFFNYLFFAARFLFNYLYKLQTDKNEMARKNEQVFGDVGASGARINVAICMIAPDL